MKLFLVILCCLFVFLGMFIGKKKDLKNVSINMIFGLFLINALVNVLLYGYSILYANYHSGTFIYVVLGLIVGFLIMNIINYKCSNSDDFSIIGFTIFNTYFLYNRFSFLLFIINIWYYILIGIYIRNSRSFISVFIGMILGLLFSLINSWLLGYVFTIVFGFLSYFIVSVYGIIFRNNNKFAYIGLVIGMILGLLGGIL